MKELALMRALENSATGLMSVRGPLDAVDPLSDAAHELAAFFGQVPVWQLLPPGRFQPI